MKIQAINMIDNDNLSKVIKIAKEHGEITLRGVYDSDVDIFYLLDGSHRIEVALQLQLPLTLINYDQFDYIDNIDIAGMEQIENKGYLIDKIFEYWNWGGETYKDSDFKSVKITNK